MSVDAQPLTPATQRAGVPWRRATTAALRKSHLFGWGKDAADRLTIMLMGKRGIAPDVAKDKLPKESRPKLPYVRPAYRRHDDKPAEAVTTQAAGDIAYSLYRGAAAEELSRFHVATFHTDGGEEHNRALCEVAREMFQAQIGDGQTFWCGKRRLR